jgi:hypothetical protein
MFPTKSVPGKSGSVIISAIENKLIDQDSLEN